MADYVLMRKSRNVISSVLHVILNILLGVGSIALTVLTASWIPGLFLVVLSKWRVFAVRPRFWMVNILSNMVDFIVGASFVFIAYCSGAAWLPIHIVLAVGYTAWLLFLKPRSSGLANELQSLATVFLGTTATTMLFASSNSIFMVLLCFLIGFSASRHVLVQSDENEFGLLTLATGLISAEIAWLVIAGSLSILLALPVSSSPKSPLFLPLSISLPTASSNLASNMTAKSTSKKSPLQLFLASYLSLF